MHSFGQNFNRKTMLKRSMNAKNLLLGIFVALTIVFASLSVNEFIQNKPMSQTQSVQGNNGASTIFTSTITSVTYSTETTESTACTAIGGLGCANFFNDSFTISIAYGGPWGLSYQGYLGNGESQMGSLIENSSFYGHGPTEESITVAGTSTVGTGLCAEAQKLDSSNSTLVLTIGSVTNQTSTAYGTTKICLVDEAV